MKSTIALCALSLCACSDVPGSSDQAVNAPDTGATVDAGVVDAPGPDTSPIVCPTAPPFDETNAALVAQCTKPLFVAVGDYTRRAVSNDGITWVDTSTKKADVPQGANPDLLAETTVTIHNGIVVAVGGNGVFYSHDGGKTFLEAPGISHPGFELYGPGVGFLNGHFWLVTEGGTWTSTDGKAWAGKLGQEQLPGQSTLTMDKNVTASFSGHGHGVIAGGGKIVFTEDSMRYRTFDGTNWFESKVGSYNGFATGIAYGGGRFLMLGSDCCAMPAPTSKGLRAVSTDGLKWSEITNDTPNVFQVADLSAALWDGSRFFVSAGPWAQEAYASPDGVAWTKTPINAAMGTLAAMDNVWAGSSHTSLLRSIDGGATWKETLTSVGEDTDKWFASIAAGRVLR